MSLSTLKYLSQIQFAGGTAIYELDDATPDAGAELLTGMAAGYPEPLWISIRSEKPRVRFSTPQLQTFLTLVNSGTAAPFVFGLSGSNTDLWYQDSSQLGGRTAAATASHQRFRMTQGCVYWTQLGGQHQQDAKVQAEILPIWDGTNNPLQYAGALALPGSPIGSERFTMGPVKVNGTFLTGVQEWQLSSGVKANEEGSEGEVYLSFGGLDMTTPVLEVTGRTVEWWNTFGPGTAISTVTAFLLKKTATGNYSNGSSQHISITGTAGLVVPESTSGRKSQTKLRIAFASPSAAGSGTPSLTVATGVAVA